MISIILKINVSFIAVDVNLNRHVIVLVTVVN